MQNTNWYFVDCFQKFYSPQHTKFDYKTPDWIHRSLTLSVKTDQNLPRNFILILRLLRNVTSTS